MPLRGCPFSRFAGRLCRFAAKVPPVYRRRPRRATRLRAYRARDRIRGPCAVCPRLVGPAGATRDRRHPPRPLRGLRPAGAGGDVGGRLSVWPGRRGGGSRSPPRPLLRRGRGGSRLRPSGADRREYRRPAPFGPPPSARHRPGCPSGLVSLPCVAGSLTRPRGRERVPAPCASTGLGWNTAQTGTGADCLLYAGAAPRPLLRRGRGAAPAGKRSPSQVARARNMRTP